MQMSSRGRGTSSYRGRGGRGIIAQFGNKKLIADNIANTASSSSSNTWRDTEEYQQFLKYQAQKGNTQKSSSYANIVVGEEDGRIYEPNSHKELILILEDKDLRWKGEPWHLLQRYLDTASFTAGSYKQRNHFENILKTTLSCEITHFPPSGKVNKGYGFSKTIIKQIISAEEWGMSTLKEREYYPNPEQKILMKFNYWDYLEAFHKALLYQNTDKTHSWFFKICPDVYNRDLPSWLYQWWLVFGTSVNILPEPYKGLYTEWVKISPKLIEAEHEGKWIEGMPSLHFFAEFGIPWIWRWEPEVGYTPQNVPCLRRGTFTKFWKKMCRQNEQGMIEGQDTVEKIQTTISKYKEQIQLKQQRDSPSPFQQISRRIKLQYGNLSRAELLAICVQEIKEDIIKNIGDDLQSDASMATSSKDDNQEDAQDPYEEEADVSIDELLNNVDELIQTVKKK